MSATHPSAAPGDVPDAVSPGRPAEPARDDGHAGAWSVDRATFLAVASEYGVEPPAAGALWSGPAERTSSDAQERGVGLRRSDVAFASQTAASRLVRVLLYAGAAVVVGSFGWWATGFEGWPFWQLIALAAAYGVAFLGLAAYGRRRRYGDLTAVAATIVAFLVPLVAYRTLSELGFAFPFEYAGFYAWIDGGWVWLELAALVGTAVLYLVFREPLLGLPFFLFAWFASTDVAARAVGVTPDDLVTVGQIVFALGVAAFVLGAVLDLRGARRHALSAHLFAALGAIGGLALWLSEAHLEPALVVAGVAFLVVGTWLGRTTYLLAGAVAGLAGVSGLAPAPIWLSLTGLAVVLAAVGLSLGGGSLTRRLEAHGLPAPQRD